MNKHDHDDSFPQNARWVKAGGDPPKVLICFTGTTKEQQEACRKVCTLLDYYKVDQDELKDGAE